MSTYAQLPRELYLLTMAMVGLLRYRALLLNPLLHAEDFLHDLPADCLCARRLFVEEYALLLEKPSFCRPCRHFYRELCPEDEVAAVEKVVDYAATLTHTLVSKSTDDSLRRSGA